MHTSVVSGSVTEFYTSKLGTLYTNEQFRKKVLSLQMLEEPIAVLGSAVVMSEEEAFYRTMNTILEEAELTLSLVDSMSCTKNDVLLEVGGGLGLVYGFLKTNGYNIWTIEPSDAGFGGYYGAALDLFSILGVDSSHFKPLCAKDAKELGILADCIFSNNVLEHVIELDDSIEGLAKVLKPNGKMIHNTVNYYVPYEPHFKMWLVPFFPRYTDFFKPRLKESVLWNGINFITTSVLEKICEKHKLNIDFKRDRLSSTFRRFGSDSEFANRQKMFVPIYKVLKYTGLLRMLDFLPVAFTTPITFVITKKI